MLLKCIMDLESILLEKADFFLLLLVTECICTLCLCYCTLYVALSMFFRVWTSFNLLRIFYVLLFWTSLKDGVRAPEKARGDTNCLS